MESKVYVVSECCPVGCGVDVVLLAVLDRQTLFAFCDSCGCTWADPRDAAFERGVNEITGLPQRAPGGIELATGDQVKAAGLESIVLKVVSDREWYSNLKELNEHIPAEVEREEAT
jgi:hypothetical protein